MTPSDCYSLCLDAAFSIHGDRPPTPAYTRIVAGLLFGTAAKESDLRYHRQLSVTHGGDTGAFGIWQVEYETAKWLLVDWLGSRPELEKNFYRWVFKDEKSPIMDSATLWKSVSKDRFLGWLQYNNRLGVGLARLRYMADPAPVPADLDAQAAYWLRVYNGRGCVKHHPESECIVQYKAAYRKHYAEVSV